MERRGRGLALIEMNGGTKGIVGKWVGPQKGAWPMCFVGVV